MKRYCKKYLESPDAEVRTRAKRMLDNCAHLFTFLIHVGVEPTNRRLSGRLTLQSSGERYPLGSSLKPESGLPREF